MSQGYQAVNTVPPSRVRIRQLEAYQAVMQMKSVTQAADMLGISQPAVSRLIQDLEITTGLKLFDRVKRRLLPTAEGLRFYSEVEQLFLKISSIDRLANEIRARGRGDLRVAAMPALGIRLIPEILATLRKARPDLRIFLAVVPSQRVVEMVAAGEVDVGFAYPVPGTPLSVVREELASLPAVAVFPHDHPFAAHLTLTPADLNGVPMISLGREDFTRDKLDAMVARWKLDINIGVETHFATVACELARSGLGVALVDPVTAHFFNDTLEQRPLEEGFNFDFGVLTLSGAPELEAAREFTQCIAEAVHRISPDQTIT